MNDTDRIDALEKLLWSGKIGNGLAIFPTISLQGERHCDITDLGDEDGSNLGSELTLSHTTLRDAIDEALKLLEKEGE